MKDWKLDARERLRDYPKRKNAVDILQREIVELKSEYGTIQSSFAASVTGKAGDEGRREDLLVENIQRRGELAEALRRSRHYVRAVEKAMETLTTEQQSLLEQMYIHPERGKAERVVEELGYSDQRYLYRVLDKALRDFTLAYFGVTEL